MAAFLRVYPPSLEQETETDGSPATVNALLPVSKTRSACPADNWASRLPWVAGLGATTTSGFTRA